MSREIKFRAWYEEEKQIYELAKADLWGDSEQATCDLANKDEELFDIYLHEVKLMQYTGYKDINDKEVYEGDILKHYPSTLDFYMIVRFGTYSNDECGKNIGFYVEHMCPSLGKHLRKDLLFWLEEAEVVGNIYENSEILKAGKLL